MSKNSSSKKLDFGVSGFDIPSKYRYETVYSSKNNKTEVINKMAKNGWELEKIDNDILYFKISPQNPSIYLYCTIDMNESSSSKKLDFGVSGFDVPSKYRYETVYSSKNNKTEVINKMAKNGWLHLKEIINGDILYFRIGTEVAVRYLYCTIDMNESSSSKKLDFGVSGFDIPSKYRYETVYSSKNNKTEIINKMAKNGWELDKIDSSTLYFKIDTEQPLTYLYCTVNMNESSSSKKLDFGVSGFDIPSKYRYETVYSSKNNKTEVINKMAKNGWELKKTDNNILYFKINPQDPSIYLYCTIDMYESSSSKKLDFGVSGFDVPSKYRYETVYSSKNNKTEVINKMAKNGWELPKEIQYGDLLLFRRKVD